MRSFDLRSLKDDMVNVNGGYVLSTVALVGASDFNAAHFAAHWKEGAFDAVIAVDGGFASLAAVDCAPDLAMGDFDSLGYVPEGMSVKAFSPEKDASDMELALEEALARGADAVEVYGALGGRLDHTVANLQLLASFAERYRVGVLAHRRFHGGCGRGPEVRPRWRGPHEPHELGPFQRACRHAGPHCPGKRHAGSVFAALALCRSLYWHYNHRLGELAAAWRPGRLRGGAEFAPTRKT